MSTIEKLFFIIDIPDSGEFTSKNEKYFIFKNNDEAMRCKHASIYTLVILGIFIIGFFFKRDSLTQFLVWGLSFLLSLLYLYINRAIFLKNRAAFQAQFSRYPQMMKYINRILKMNSIFDKDMPLAYYILKGKTLIEKGDYHNAELLADRAKTEYQLVLPVALLKIVSCWKQNKFDDCKTLLNAILKNEKVNEDVKSICVDLIKEIKTGTEV